MVSGGSDKTRRFRGGGTAAGVAAGIAAGRGRLRRATRRATFCPAAAFPRMRGWPGRNGTTEE